MNRALSIVGPGYLKSLKSISIEPNTNFFDQDAFVSLALRERMASISTDDISLAV